MTRNSPAVQAALDQWRKGYVPTAYSQRLFCSEYRQSVQAALAQLDEIVMDCDALDIVENFRSCLKHIERLETDLRQRLAGDRHPAADDARAAPIRRAS